MIDLAQLDDLARRLGGLLPPSLRESREELQENFKSVLQAGLARLDLVTREEFEVQREVLLKTREKLEALERSVAELEAALQAGRMLHVRVVGLARIAADVPADLARQTIGSITVLGALQAPAAVKAALADRIS